MSDPLTIAEWTDATLETRRLASSMLKRADEIYAFLSRLEGSLATVQRVVGEAVVTRLECLEEKVSEMTVLADRNYSQQVVDPLARQLVSVLDTVEQVRAAEAESPVLGAVSDQLLEVLAHLGVDPLPVQVGNSFEPQRMKPVARTATAIRSQHNRVSKVLRAGFWRDKHVLRPAAVAVFQYSKDQALKGVAA